MKTKQKSVLDNLYLAAPCSVPWESMIGDNSKRSCTGCSKNVYNISDMTRTEAEAFLLANGTTECMKFYRRTDGTIMTDNCPRALRKLRDQCKFAAKIAVGLVAFFVSLPSAIAQSVQTGDTTPIQTNGKKILAPTVVPHVAYPGGAVAIRHQPEPVKPDVPVNIDKTSPTNLSTQVRIITKERTLPNGKKVHLVVEDENGRVLRSEKNRHRKVDTNPLMDKRALEFFAKAQDAESDKNFDLAEFYFEKTLEMIDQQKTPDPGFRKRVEADLQSLKLRNNSGCNIENRTKP